MSDIAATRSSVFKDVQTYPSWQDPCPGRILCLGRAVRILRWQLFFPTPKKSDTRRTLSISEFVVLLDTIGAHWRQRRTRGRFACGGDCK
jgi:hypothetical protein